MYCIAGDLKIRPAPETLIGETGLYHHEQRGEQGSVTINKHSPDQASIIAARNHHVKLGRLPADAQVELITSAEQAEKYLLPQILPVEVRALKKPDVRRIAHRHLRPDQELLSGRLRLWHEKLRRSRVLSLTVESQLVEELEYDPATGWLASAATGGEGVVTGLLFRKMRGYSLQQDEQ